MVDWGLALIAAVLGVGVCVRHYDVIDQRHVI
jgi:hypothetical protein